MITARLVPQGNVGFIAFIEQVPALMAWGASREEAEKNLKKRFAAWLAHERNHGDQLDELTVLWVAEREVIPRWSVVYVAGESGAIVAYVEELTGALAQGDTIDEARAHIREAVLMILGANRRTTSEDFKGSTVLRRERLDV